MDVSQTGYRSFYCHWIDSIVTHWHYDSAVGIDDMTRYPFVDQHGYANMTSDTYLGWLNNLQAFLTNLRNTLTQSGHGSTKIIYNGLGVDSYPLDTMYSYDGLLWRGLYGTNHGLDLMGYADGGVMEGFHSTAWRNATGGLDIVLGMMSQLRDMGKIFLAGTHYTRDVDLTLSQNFGLPPDTAWRSTSPYPYVSTFYRMQMSYLARFLLVTPNVGSQGVFATSFQPGTSNWQFIPYYRPWDERIGTPLPQYANSYKDSAGMYIRDFTNCMVFVNKDVNSSVVLNPPTAYQLYHYAYGNLDSTHLVDPVAVSGPITLNKMEGTVLFKKIPVDQLLANGTTHVDSVGHWYRSHFVLAKMPRALPLTMNSSEILRASQKVDSSQLKQKYNVWNVDNNVQNHRSISITPAVRSIVSSFQPVATNDTIKTDLLDAPGTTGGKIQFADPWFIDTTDQYGQRNHGMPASFKTRTSPFNPNLSSPYDGSLTYKGVFLNQPIIAGYAYYSVGAPQPDTINGYPSYLWRWTGSSAIFQDSTSTGSQTGVVFTSAGATAKAKYKAHLASSNYQVTGFSYQRRIIRDSLGVYHMFYESTGRTWYCRSTDGVTWGQEKQISTEGYVAGNPSLTVQQYHHLIALVWEEYLVQSGQSTHNLMARLVDPVVWPPNGTNTTLYTVSAGVPTSLLFSPVVASGRASSQYFLVVWYDPTSAQMMAKLRSDSSGTWYGSFTLRMGSISSVSLAPISVLGAKQPNAWQIVWIEGGNLYHADIQFSLSPSLTNTYLVAPGDAETITIQSPSTSAFTTGGLGGTSVTWRDWSSGLGKSVIGYREWVMNQGWGTTTFWSIKTMFYSLPTVSTNHQSDRKAIVWVKDPDQTKQLTFVKYENSAWSNPVTLATGLNPTLSVGWSNPNPRTEINLSTGGTLPYVIQQNSITFSTQGLNAAQGGSLGTQITEGRGGRLYTDSGTLSLVVLSADLDGNPVSFAPLSDTLVVQDASMFSSALRTTTFSGTGTLSVQVLYNGWGKLAQSSQISLVAKDTSTKATLATVATFSGIMDTAQTVSFALNYPGRNIILAFQPVGTTAQTLYNAERWFLIQEATPAGGASQGLLATPSIESNPLPRTFGLPQNYPNPFNPTTTMRYELPSDAHVHLKVFDLLGREVVTLVEGDVSAGYQQTQFDAGKLASGVYFYRMDARSLDRAKPGMFTSVKKMLVVK